MDWLDSHSGSVQAVATLVLVVLTAYYAWTTRALVRETHTTLRAAARATLQARLDRISEIGIAHPQLFSALDDPNATGEERDERFYYTNMFLGVLEEAYTQFALERSMPADDWSAWEATVDTFLPRRYVRGYWEQVQQTYEPSFRRYVNERLARAPD
jgi:hypothetical protein